MIDIELDYVKAFQTMSYTVDILHSKGIKGYVFIEALGEINRSIVDEFLSMLVEHKNDELLSKDFAKELFMRGFNK